MAARYRKLKNIGSGSFGTVWLVDNEKTSCKYVMKEIIVKSLSEKERDQTLTEVEILAKCKHLNIIRYRSAFVDKERGTMSIVMEHAIHGDLQKIIEAQKGTFFKEETAADWFVQICFGLKYIHSLNILHRDLKTENIFLAYNNIIKIGDFGISKIMAATSDCANTVIGTPFYLSPEIIQHQPYNVKSDMWAAGCVLYNLCCLTHPFDAPDLGKLIPRILAGNFKPVPSSYSPMFEDLVTVLLRQDPACRPSAAQLLCVRALQPFVDAYLARSSQLRESLLTPHPSREKATPRPATKRKGSASKRSTPTATNPMPGSGATLVPLSSVDSSQRSVRKCTNETSGRKEQTPQIEQNKENIIPGSVEEGMKKVSNQPESVFSSELSVKATASLLRAAKRLKQQTMSEPRPGLRAVDSNIPASVALRAPRNRQASLVPSPKQSLFRAVISKRKPDDRPDAIFENKSAVKGQGRANLKGGITYTVQQPVNKFSRVPSVDNVDARIEQSERVNSRTEQSNKTKRSVSEAVQGSALHQPLVCVDTTVDQSNKSDQIRIMANKGATFQQPLAVTKVDQSNNSVCCCERMETDEALQHPLDHADTKVDQPKNSGGFRSGADQGTALQQPLAAHKHTNKVDQWNKSDRVAGGVNSEEASQPRSVLFDVCCCLWNASLKLPADNFAAQEMVRIFLEKCLGADAAKAGFEKLRSKYQSGESLQTRWSENDGSEEYLPLLIKLVELDASAAV